MDTNISYKINEVSSSDTCVVDNNESNCNGYESNLSQDVNDIMNRIFCSDTENVIESLRFDTNNQKENEINVGNEIEFNENQKTYESKEKHELDIIYNPCELDFQISAQLVQDAIYGTDIYFKHNRISLM
jgi:hypothetical protein